MRYKTTAMLLATFGPPDTPNHRSLCGRSKQLLSLKYLTIPLLLCLFSSNVYGNKINLENLDLTNEERLDFAYFTWGRMHSLDITGHVALMDPDSRIHWELFEALSPEDAANALIQNGNVTCQTRDLIFELLASDRADYMEQVANFGTKILTFSSYRSFLKNLKAKKALIALDLTNEELVFFANMTLYQMQFGDVENNNGNDKINNATETGPKTNNAAETGQKINNAAETGYEFLIRLNNAEQKNGSGPGIKSTREFSLYDSTYYHWQLFARLPPLKAAETIILNSTIKCLSFGAIKHIFSATPVVLKE